MISQIPYEWRQTSHLERTDGSSIVCSVFSPPAPPEEIRGVMVEELLAYESTRLQWTATDKKQFSLFMQKHGHGHNVKAANIDELLGTLKFITSDDNLNAILRLKTRNALAYHVTSALSHVGIMYDRSVVPMRAIWPDWCRAWQSSGWDGDTSKDAALRDLKGSVSGSAQSTGDDDSFQSEVNEISDEQQIQDIVDGIKKILVQDSVVKDLFSKLRHEVPELMETMLLEGPRKVATQRAGLRDQPFPPEASLRQTKSQSQAREDDLAG